jgi:hypothetical protein
MTYWVLDDAGEPRQEPDIRKWAVWFERTQQTRERVLAQDRDELGGTDIMVSTVFLAIDHNFRADGPPILWETMILGGPLDGYQRRFASAAAALDGHREACRLANEAAAASRTTD